MEKDRLSKRHENREDLAGEHIWGDAGQIILLLIFLVIWVIDSFVLTYSTFLSNYVPLYFRILNPVNDLLKNYLLLQHQ